MNDGTTPRYRWHERRNDQWRGRRAGRTRNPTYTDVCALTGRGQALSARYPDRLLWTALGHINGQYLAFEQRTASARTSLARLRDALGATEAGLERSGAAIAMAEAPLTEAELRPQNHYELALDSPLILRNRRDKMRELRIQSARDNEAALLAARDDINNQIATVREQIKNEFVLAQVAARQTGAHCALRIATFWENFVLAHPEGAHLTPVFRVVVQLLPWWVTASPDLDPADLGRGLFQLNPVVQNLDQPIGVEDSDTPEESGAEEDDR